MCTLKPRVLPYDLKPFLGELKFHREIRVVQREKMDALLASHEGNYLVNQLVLQNLRETIDTYRETL